MFIDDRRIVSAAPRCGTGWSGRGRIDLWRCGRDWGDEDGRRKARCLLWWLGGVTAKVLHRAHGFVLSFRWLFIRHVQRQVRPITLVVIGEQDREQKKVAIEEFKSCINSCCQHRENRDRFVSHWLNCGRTNTSVCDERWKDRARAVVWRRWMSGDASQVRPWNGVWAERPAVAVGKSPRSGFSGSPVPLATLSLWL